MTRKYAKLLLSLLVLAGIFLAAVLAIVLRTPARLAPPNPNGYDEFVKASQGLSPNVSQFSALDHDQLAALVSANAEALRLLRVGLARQCLAPQDFALTNTAGLVGQLSGMKRLAQLLAAEGRLYQMNNQPGQAARSYLDVIRFGNEMSRGGLLITRLVGIACESIGSQELTRLAPTLSAAEQGALIPELQKVDDNRVSWAEVLRAEKNCARYHFRNHPNPILLATSWWHTRQAFQKAETRNKTVIAQERLLLTELALRCYQADRSRLPARLTELVPAYLAKVPQDPFNADPLTYRPQAGTNWLLYSVGPDRVDDGGKLLNPRPPAKGDILAHSST